MSLLRKIYLIPVFFSMQCIFADNSKLQEQLMLIASQEAQIANIGANKTTMLYGAGDVLAIINRWNYIENKSSLNNQQIEQIKQLEQQKMNLLKQVHN